jgi:uncharacterized coiled-coil protein SlyX
MRRTFSSKGYKMAQSDAKIKFLEQELDEQEKLIKMMEVSGPGAATEERIAALERKMREMEALVKGLTQELLDLKSIAMKMSKQTEERSRQELKRAQPIVQSSQSPQAASGGQAGSGTTIVMRKGAKSDVPEAPAEPVMDMIMQPDGTMKLEPRRGDKDYIVARAGYGQKKGAAGRSKQNDVIYAAEDSKTDPAKK